LNPNFDAGAEGAAFHAAVIHRMAVPQTTKATMLTGSADEVAARVMGIVREKMGVSS
jgi:hypothetical protein